MNKAKEKVWFSNGNLIISGEYFVLVGAKALAVPLRFGQEMKIECHRNKQNAIHWKTNELGNTWFKAEFSCDKLIINNSSDMGVALKLQRLLKVIQKLKPEKFSKDMSFDITCDIHFNIDWGWGSSSTLISNLANWAGINPFELHKQVSSGSGYDIAASLYPGPIIFEKTIENQLIEQVDFNPPFKEFISFVYLGRKQDTERSIDKNIASVKNNKKLIPVISSLTEKIVKEKNVNEFVRSIVEHEKILSTILNMKRIKEEYFSDFKGEIKSLGAWGGDFAMIVSPFEKTYIRQYFDEKQLDTVFSFDEIIKTGNTIIK